MLIQSITNNVDHSVKGVASEDQMFIDCLCDMLENVEKQSAFTSNDDTYTVLKMHSRVIRKVLEQNLSLEK